MYLIFLIDPGDRYPFLIKTNKQSKSDVTTATTTTTSSTTAPTTTIPTPTTTITPMTPTTTPMTPTTVENTITTTPTNFIEEDRIETIKIRFSAKEAYLESVWVGLPGVKTEEFTANLKQQKGLVVFYNEIQNEYISTSFSQCKKENDTVFQTFAHSLIDHRDNFTQFCPNFCMPIYVEPITDTIAHKIPDCDNNFDYYCMWKPGPLKVATTLAPLSMKPCLVKSPKLNDFPSKFFQSSLLTS